MEDYLIGSVRDSFTYIDKMSRGGLSKFPPLIISCAITGGLHGAEVNPNLPETAEAQTQAAYDAYNAGASMVHIHRRNPENLGTMSWKAEEFTEVNAMIRAKCPDLIINNTCLGGRRLKDDKITLGEPMLASIDAKPEVASLDIHCFALNLKVKARKPPLSGRDQDGILAWNYMMTEEDAVNGASKMLANDIKPELEIYDPADIKYLNLFISRGIIKKPYWISALFNGNGTFPMPELMMTMMRALPPESLMSIIGIGAAQFPMLAMGIVLGMHVRVGLEDNVMYAPGELAKSNAQMVERVVRLAKELGRPIATPTQAREMMGLGAPREYNMPARS